MKYEDVTNKELDRLSANRSSVRLYKHEGSGDYYLWEGEKISHDKWQPTDRDSNQCDRYLFPKLRHLPNADAIFSSLKIEVTYPLGQGCIVEINRLHAWSRLVMACDEDDEINRTKVITVLKAWDELK